MQPWGSSDTKHNTIKGEQLVVSSVNCRGLQELTKRIDVLDYLNRLQSNIICLQDTHWTDKDMRHIKSVWNNEIIIHGIRTNARGVAILLKNNFEFEILSQSSDEEGNLLVLDLKIANDFTIRIINLYAPNSDSP